MKVTGVKNANLLVLQRLPFFVALEYVKQNHYSPFGPNSFLSIALDIIQYVTYCHTMQSHKDENLGPTL